MGYAPIKRACDVVIAALGLVFLAPVAGLIALGIKMDSPGPAMFRQRRVGLQGATFEMLKFRTMTTSAPAEVPTADLLLASSYITPIGRFLRKTSLDELPQLINVLLGEMSLVGPRPVILAETKLTRLRSVAGALSVRPGLTGWAQVNGRELVTVEQKVAYDREYVERMSPVFDAVCVVRTFTTVLSRRGHAEGDQLFAVIPDPAQLSSEAQAA